MSDGEDGRNMVEEMLKMEDFEGMAGVEETGAVQENPLASSGNFFENEKDRLAQISLPTPGARDLMSSDKKTLKQKVLNKPSKHIEVNDRETQMTDMLKKIEKKEKKEKKAVPKKVKVEPKKEKVLVVEDNVMVQKVLGALLTSFGYVHIIRAANGEEGVKLFQEEKPDIILLDLFMPVMDGGECCAQIRKLPNGANVPIIGVTAHDDPKEIGEFLDNGMNGVLTKPVKKNQLERVMNRFVGDAAGKAVYTKENWKAVVSKKQPAPEKAKVLVVEDNKLIQKVMEALLKRLKFQHIFFCSNGMEAIASVRDNHFDIIFMDLYMPEMDGVEATAEIRKHSTGANIPIIACTGHAIESDTKLCVRYGMNDLILKPVKEKALITILRRYGFTVSVAKKKQKTQQQRQGPVSALLRESSLANMTDLHREKAMSTTDFNNIAASHVQREDSQGGLPLVSLNDTKDLGRFRAMSQASFPNVEALQEEEQKIDLTGVALTKMVPIQDLDEDEANTMTFAPGDDIRSVFRYHSSIFIEGVLEGGGGWEEEGGEGGEGGEVGGGRVGRMVGGLGDEGSFGGDGDGAEVPFSLKSIMQRNDLDNGSKLNMMWNDYLLTEGSFAAGDLSDGEEAEGVFEE